MLQNVSSYMYFKDFSPGFGRRHNHVNISKLEPYFTYFVDGIKGTVEFNLRTFKSSIFFHLLCWVILNKPYLFFILALDFLDRWYMLGPMLFLEPEEVDPEYYHYEEYDEEALAAEEGQ